MAAEPVAPGEVLALRAVNPCATMTEIGLAVGLSRERVRQILKRGGVRTASVGSDGAPRMYRCQECGSEFQSQARPRVFCSKQCRRNNRSLELVCAEETCGRTFRRTLALINAHQRRGLDNTKRAFCGKACAGRHVGKNHGQRNVTAAWEARRKHTRDTILGLSS
jgi:hypothetical protein